MKGIAIEMQPREGSANLPAHGRRHRILRSARLAALERRLFVWLQNLLPGRQYCWAALLPVDCSPGLSLLESAAQADERQKPTMLSGVVCKI